MKSLLSENPRKPEEWGFDATAQHGWKHAYSIAKKYTNEFIGEDKSAKNPHRKYWLDVCKWIEVHAPKDALKDTNEH